MADSREQEVDKLVADFGERTETLRREGVPSYPPLGGRTPWAEAPETEKLEAIVWESMSIWLGAESFAPGAVGPKVIAVPGAAALEAVERHVDYAGLPTVQREMLEALRAGLDAGQFDGPTPKHKDALADALGRVVGVGDFDRMVRDAKEGEDRPWVQRPAAEKVRALVDLAAEAYPPGAYTLAVIEREVDYAQLPPWRREALEGLRVRLDRGEFDGEHSHPLSQDDRAETALRLAELEARVEDDKRLGALDGAGRRWPWQELGEEVKFDLIMAEIRELHLESEAAAYHVIGREVDMARAPEETRREFADSRAEAWPGPPGQAEKPVYQVWHDRGWPLGRIEQGFGAQRPPSFPDQYFHAADVQADSLPEAVRLTTSQGHVLEGDHRPWDENRGVRSYTPKPFVPRDTDAGDVIVDPRGQAHLYDGTGLRAIEATARQPLPSPGALVDDRDDDLPTPEEWRKLKAEWTHDYGLRRLEERGARYEDEAERTFDDAPARGTGKGRAGERLPSPGELAEDLGGAESPGPERGQERGR